ncbi:MAG TPA: sigma 54-interacting transcriptional regulator [Rubrivivax sp.]|nr:sigma 54-interacting transcriptional regulator [Rubrivivax sp.]
MEALALQDKITAAWHRFVETGQVDLEVIRHDVAASWKRCRDSGLDPYAPKLPVRLDARELQQVMADNQILAATALPFMQSLSDAARSGDFILSLTDRNAVVLEVFGDEEIVELGRGNNYKPGCIRSEAAVGTNAICLSLSERKPIQLTGAEHYKVGHHRWMCASAPVFGPDDELLGAVTITVLLSKAHSLSLGMVISVAEAIHDRLCEREARQLGVRSQALLASVLNSITEGIVTIDASGLVANVNPMAGKLLGIRPDAAVGKSVLKLFPGNPELASVLVERNDSGPLEVSAGDAQAPVSLIVTPYFMRSEAGTEGAILMLRARKDHLNDVRDITGFRATFRFEDIVGRSPLIRQQIELGRMAAKQTTRILITGETGTGKELFAQSIHNASPRKDGPFVALNCGAIPRELIESELFGYKGGAFTGSRKGGHVGKFELADGGTLFLDEINTMPLDLQSKLLRTLQEGTVTRLGDSKPVRVDVRVIAATNEDLYEKSREHAFRMDLYFRLSVVEVNLPPLRERGDDIVLIAEAVLLGIASKLGKPGLSLSREATELLLRYPWVGNVRELENVLEMAAIVCTGDVLEPPHLAYRMKGLNAASASRARAQSLGAPPLPAQPLRDSERDLILTAMRENDGNVALVSRRLGISRSTIYRRMSERGLSRADWSA